MDYIEIEQKYALPDDGRLRGRLIELGAVPSAPVRQVDTYYNPPHRDFLEPAVISEWLRLREQAGKDSVNYKHWLPEDALIKTHCDEYESKISDVGALRRMLVALNFTPIVTVSKVREEWRFQDVIVAIDKVEGLGSYVEFEFDGEADDIQDALERLTKFVAELEISLDEALTIGYPHLLLGREH